MLLPDIRLCAAEVLRNAAPFAPRPLVTGRHSVLGCMEGLLMEPAQAKKLAAMQVGGRAGRGG